MNSLCDILKLVSNPKKICIIFEDKKFTYSEIEIFSNKFANFIKNNGIKKDERFAIYCVNSPYFIISYFGILKAGCVVVPINFLLHPEEIKFILNDSSVKGLIYDGLFDENVSFIKNEIKNVKFLITTGNFSNLNAISLKEILNKESEKLESLKIDKKEKVAEIIYTSGTTGKVKGVILTHDNLISNINSICKFLPITQNDIFVSVLPFFHAFGSTCGMLVPLKLGATIILFSKFVPDVILKNIEKFSATIFMGIPSMFKVFNDLSKKEIFDLSSLRLCISGAAPLNLNIMDDFEKNFGIPIYEGYGLTECSPVVSVNPFGKRKKGSVGLPLPGVSMKIVDENGEELKEGEIGEIIVKGENVMKGYLNQPEETEKNIFKRMA